MESLQLKLCDIQGRLFELSLNAGFDSISFIKAFMTSDVAENLDSPYNRMQWAGEEYLLEELIAEKKDDLIKSNTQFSRDVLFWIGYIYRYWHFYRNESSKTIYRIAPAETMERNYLMFHTMDAKMAIDDLIEIYNQKQRKKELVSLSDRLSVYETLPFRVTININDVAPDKPIRKQFSLEIDEFTTLQMLIEKADYSLGDVSDYYHFSKVWAHNNFIVPYLFTRNGLMYDVAYEDVRVIDFLNTHHITNGTLRITTGYAQAGGPGFLDLAEIWDSTYPILEQLSVILGITGLSLQSFISGIKWLCNHFRKEERTPQCCFDIVYSRKRWNHYELASYLDIPADNAKHLLRALGYEYDKKQTQYIQAKQVTAIKKRLKSIEVLDK